MKTGIHKKESSSWMSRLLLLFMIVSAGGYAWGAETEIIYPYNSLNLKDGATYETILLKESGSYTLNLSGTTTIVGGTDYRYFNAPDSYHSRGAILVKSNQTLYIKGTGTLKVNGEARGWENSYRDGGDNFLPGIEIEDGGTVIVDGPILVESKSRAPHNTSATGYRNITVPGIGGRVVTHSNPKALDIGKSGTLILRGGASFYTDHVFPQIFPSPERPDAMARVSIEDYACLTTPGMDTYKNLNSSNYYQRNVSFNNLTPSTSSAVPIKIENKNKSYSMRFSSNQNYATFYFNDSWSPSSSDYGTINGVPFPIDNRSTVNLGIAYVYKDGSTEFYPTLNTTFLNDIYLNVSNFPSEGELKTAGSAEITLFGNGKILNTTTGGLKLSPLAYTNNHTAAPLRLNSNTVNNTNAKLIINGPVLLYRQSDASNNNTIKGKIVDTNGNDIQYYKATINQIQDYKFYTAGAVTTDGIPSNNYYYDTRYTNKYFYVWVRAGSNITTKATISDGNIRYTGITPDLPDHQRTGNFWPTDYNVFISNITATTSGASHTINYNSKNFVIPNDQTISVWNTSPAIGKTILCNNTFSGNLLLDKLDMSGAIVPLTIKKDATATVFVSGTNKLSSTTNAISVETDGKLSFAGASGSKLELTGTSPYNDLDNQGTLTIGGDFELYAKNSLFPPKTIISDDFKFYLGDKRYYLAQLKTTLGKITNIAYADGTSCPDINYAAYNGKDNFWIPADSKGFSFRSDGTLYGTTLSTGIDKHNIVMEAIEVIASISTTIYNSLKDAFDAVISGQTIKVEATHSIAVGKENLQPTKIKDGENFTLDLANFTVNTAANTILSSGRGILTIQAGTGEMAGQYTLNGCVFTKMTTKLGTPMLEGSPVYRTTVSGLPLNVSDPITYKWANTYYKGFRNGETLACIWLPSGKRNVILADYAFTSEDVATGNPDIQTNHSNTFEASPLLNIGSGDITIQKNTTTDKLDVRYGKKPYLATLEAGTTADRRLAIYGKARTDDGQNNQVVVDATGITTVYLTLNNMEVKPGTKTPLLVKTSTDIELQGNNLLTGASGNGSGLTPAIDAQAALTLRGEASGKGRLNATGGRLGSNAQPAIASTAAVTIADGTYLLRHGKDNTGKIFEGEPYPIESPSLKILAGSIDARGKIRPTNTKNQPVYRVSITTGLTPDQVYRMDYDGVDEKQNRLIMPDAAGKAYAWMPKRETATDKATNVDFFNSANNVTTPIEVVEVKENDKNVAPIVARLINRKTGESSTYGNLYDTFQALASGSAAAHTVYDIELLTNIYNLRTIQTIPAYTDVYLDLGVGNIEAQNGSSVAFDASANGAYLNIVGKGNLKNTFRVAGDVFITQQVPLTDAVVIKNNLPVFRVLLKNPVLHAEGNTYKYTYSGQTETFFVHDNQACLWLPSRENSELRMVLTVQGGSSTEYSAGNITTSTQRTDLIELTPVNVVARLTWTAAGVANDRPCKTLQEAFDATTTLDATVTDATVRLLRSESISGALKVSGTCSFTLNLDGKNLTSASGGMIEVGDGARLIVTDLTAGTKGNLQADIHVIKSGMIHVAGVIRLSGNLYKDNDKTSYFWRTLVNMSYQSATIKTVTFDGIDYPVIDQEVCLWLPAASEKEYTFTINPGGEIKTKGIIVTGKHDNELTLGGTNSVARVGDKSFGTLSEAFIAADMAKIPVELMKTFNLPADYSISPAGVYTLEMAKYELSGTQSLTVPASTNLIVRSTGSTGGKLTAPINLADASSSILYIGKTINGDGIGTVTSSDNKQYYRLLVDGLPADIPTGIHEYIFYNSVDKADRQTGKFQVFDGVGCFWFEATTTRDELQMLGSDDYLIKNIALNKDHFNTQTFGVDMVAQIRNGASYPDLYEAFSNGANQTISLLKNTALKTETTVSGSIILEMGGFAISSTSPKFTIPAGSNLLITGKGSLGTDFSMQPVADYSTNSNYNLQTDKDIVLNGKTENRYRVYISGLDLPANQQIDYTYGTQSGKVKTDSNGTLCLWLNDHNTPSNFLLNLPVLKETYLATQVVVQNHTSISVTKVGAVAMIGQTPYEKLEMAIASVTDGDIITLNRDVEEQAADLILGTGKNATFNLVGLTVNGKAISIQAGTDITSQLMITNGILSGKLSLAGNVYVDDDVIMTNAYIGSGGKTVWRTFVTLPGTVTSFDYRLDSTTVTSVNLKTNIDGTSTACLWLPSSNVGQRLTVTIGGQEYALDNVIIASTHGNELNLTGDNKPVAKDANNKQFASLTSALINGTSPVTLLKDVTLSSVQTITKDATLDLSGFTITSGNGGFEEASGKTLTFKNSKTAGMLAGTFRLIGDGTVTADKTVKIAGIVLNAKNEEIYRIIITSNSKESCHWLRPASFEKDQEVIDEDGSTWQATIPINLNNHNTVLTAYKLITLAGSSNMWNASAQTNTNIVLAANTVWTIPEGTNSTIHRLTIQDGAQVEAIGQLTITEGIRYVRAFNQKNRWESIALPFPTTRITAIKKGEKDISLLTPATNTGTMGDFWLYTIQMDGKQEVAGTLQLEGNISYIMAVAENLEGNEITFVSGANQIVRRNPVQAVVPLNGFASYANGTLGKITVKDQCYILDAAGDQFTRQLANYELLPFRGYLLADMATTQSKQTLRMGTTVDNDKIVSSASSWQLTARNKRIMIDSPKEMLLQIYTFAGYRIQLMRIPAGHTEIPVPEGSYIVNGRKIVVR